MVAKKTEVEQVRACVECGRPTVSYSERVVINLGDYQSLGIDAGYRNISDEEDLAAMKALMPKVVTAVDGDMGELIQQSLGNGSRDDMKAAVLAAVAKLPYPEELKKK